MARVCLALMAVVLVAVSAPASAPAQGRPDSFADLADRLLPSVVNVSTTQTMQREDFPEIPNFPEGSPFEDFFRDFFERRGEQPSRPRRATSLGSGFIIDTDGHIVTNNHVIEGADEITVILHDDTNLSAEVVGRDERTDLAVLKVDTDLPLQPIEWGDSGEMRVGDWVIAIGNPFGLGGTVTAGIISARSRNINAGPYDDFLQTDASINRGNSGGPMFNLDGDVIGINTAIFSPSGGSVGIGFAIPSALARNVIDQIVEFGRTRRGWLGVRIQTVTEEIAEGLGLDGARGALVAGVTPDGPAEDAGIEPGDVVISFDGEPVEEMRELPRMVAETSVGASVPVEIWRQGEVMTVEVDLGELEEAEAEGLLAGEAGPETSGDTAEFADLGLTVGSLTAERRQEFGIGEDIEGVVILDVAPGSAAEEKGLAAGEVILEVGQEAVTSPGDIAERIDQAREAGRRSVLLLIEREGDLRFVALGIGDG
ncbi:MAG: DegQ family serine endoprotease [Azospirillaceae bacterium]